MSFGPTSAMAVPVRPARPVPSASSTVAQHGDRGLASCGEDYLRRPPLRTGGPYAASFCYAPVTPVTGCLLSNAPSLPRLLGAPNAQCTYDGPHAQSDPATGAPWCCYNLGFMGEGRPLWVDRTRRQAPLRSGAWA